MHLCCAKRYYNFCKRFLVEKCFLPPSFTVVVCLKDPLSEEKSLKPLRWVRAHAVDYKIMQRTARNVATQDVSKRQTTNKHVMTPETCLREVVSVGIPQRTPGLPVHNREQ